MLFIDHFMLAMVVFSIIILFVVTFVSRMSNKPYRKENRDIANAIKLRNSWLSSSIVCLFTHYWCILFSILLTLVVLYLSCFEDTNSNQIKVRLVLYSALSLFINILPYVINLKKISAKYRGAYLALVPSLNALTCQPFANAIEKGEGEIDQAFTD